MSGPRARLKWRRAPKEASAALRLARKRVLKKYKLPRVRRSIPIYLVSSDESASPRGTLVAWKFIFSPTRGVMLSAEVNVSHGGYSFAHLSEGPFGRVLIDYVDVAARFAPTTSSLEPRLIRIPSLQFVAVWLHGRKEDYVLPMPHDATPPVEVKAWNTIRLYLRERSLSLRQGTQTP
jgi:hypothetical protein